MILFNPDTDVIVEQPAGPKDGRTRYTRVPVRDFDLFSTIQDGKIILIAPPVIPETPGRIVAGTDV